MCEFIAEILSVFVWVGFYWLGMKILPVISFGTARAADRVEKDEDGEDVRSLWREDGKVVFSANLSALLGFLSLLAAIVALCHAF